MNEKLRDILIKLTLTIPALLLGVVSAILFILKPTYDLWSKSKRDLTPPVVLPVVEDTVNNHVFM
jgi:hypothetical protein